MKRKTILACVIFMLLTPQLAKSKERILFTFDEPKSTEQWQAVNDGVMGGRSEGRFRINTDKNMELFGRLSLENNGGFASIRSRPAEKTLGISKSDSLVVRVRGDGRRYNVNLYVPRGSGGYSYRQSFATKKNEWVEVSIPVSTFVATYRGQTFASEKLDAQRVHSVGFLLGDKKAGPFKLEVESIKVRSGGDGPYHATSCEGTYPHHLQGICVDADAIYWSFTTQLVKTNLSGKLLKKVPVANHHGDLCYHDGKLLVAVNLGKFNDPAGNADSWVYVYDAKDLSLVTKHETQEVFHGAGGIGWKKGNFFVVGGLPDGVEKNYVYEYNSDFRFLKKHDIASGHTHLGIQTGAFADGRWWFGCYGSPKILLVTDADFKMKGRYEFDCSLGIVGLPDGRFLSASGRSDKDVGCSGRVRLVVPDKQAGFKVVEQ